MTGTRKSAAKQKYHPIADPGVASLTRIYNYYKKFGHKTQVMGASFRNVNQIVRLAGCDLLTISPELLDQLEKTEGILERKLDPGTAPASKEQRVHLDKKTFRWVHNEDAMATEKLAEGIRKFNTDAHHLEEFALSQVVENVGSGEEEGTFRFTNSVRIVRPIHTEPPHDTHER